MKITINNAGKRFNYEWVLKNIRYTFESGNAYAVLGPNGSGKSTLLRMIAGLLAPSTGTIIYEDANHPIEVDQIFRKLSISAPYLDLVEELTLEEHFAFQQQFKPLLHQLSIADAIAITQLKPGSSKQIRNYSSGMKQRLKVALAVLSDVPLLLLDEPTTNLDEKGVAWYVDLMKKFGGDRLIIVCSNVAREYSFCSHKIEVLDFK